MESRVKVLVCDNSEGCRQTIIDLIKQYNPEIEIVQAETGEEVIRKASEERFAAVILDVVLPDMTGYDAAKELNKNEFRSHTVPIIFVSGVDKSDEGIIKGYSVGAIKYFLKPLNPEDFINELKTLVSLFEQWQI